MKVKAFVHAQWGKHYDRETHKFFEGFQYQAWPSKCDAWGTLVYEQEIELPLIDENALTLGQVKIMRAEQQKIRADAEVKFQNIEQQIQEMLCIEDKSEVPL